MRGKFLVQKAMSEPGSSYFVGTVTSGSLRRGMEAICEKGVLTIRSIEDPEGRNGLEKAKRGDAISLYCDPALPLLEELVGTDMIFEDKKTAPLRKEILLKPELG